MTIAHMFLSFVDILYSNLQALQRLACSYVGSENCAYRAEKVACTTLEVRGNSELFHGLHPLGERSQLVLLALGFLLLGCC